MRSWTRSFTPGSARTSDLGAFYTGSIRVFCSEWICDRMGPYNVQFGGMSQLYLGAIWGCFYGL